ncbi:MAG: hypothetical protein ACRD0A_11670 [Acidimicrobiales bacterium]
MEAVDSQSPATRVDARSDDRAATEASARAAFKTSILVSAVRCLFAYVLLPALAPIIDLTRGVGPVVGLVVGAVSAVAIGLGIRRFWAADSRWKWAYTVIGIGVLVLLGVQAVGDVSNLSG